MRLSPADDILISVERALDLDSEGQLIASVLSKKIAAGSSHVVLDIPVGPTAKVRNAEDAHRIAQGLVEVAEAFGLKAKPVFTDGTQPVGRGIGPALEARDVLAVLDNAAHAPHDLRERAVLLGRHAAGVGRQGARRTPASPWRSRCWRAARPQQNSAASARRKAACARRRSPRTGIRSAPAMPAASLRSTIGGLRASPSLPARPDDKAAGVELHVTLGHEIERGHPLYTIHAETPGELDYALEYALANPDIYIVTAP